MVIRQGFFFVFFAELQHDFALNPGTPCCRGVPGGTTNGFIQQGALVFAVG
ncbi:hypothetical protein ACFOEM_00945 [Paenalcaligenes hominis]|uniref:hypothetical protein n=1 Tax=Paenalcaligenes hominis TaxID=643674 RepID=UPI0036206FE7